ncbi:SDR family oxidoreductase [Burkholderia sp. D-99]|uniref:SDR family NAD(P)-dependent oxidoreductase n=1 Tax=Burkholderia sp. D-99 TaxID=2717316 RepID=UPI0014214243|nr:SDR family NAD(P)-dependent oxidoreductase [Burkholderia sp. D-99]NHV25896.1 SDR family NAD(P)-dependent oxidoreductase [Burkholderia sp. D-99]
MEQREMNERTALVTGAANGIGRGLALALGERGYRVIACDIAVDEAAAVVREIEAKGGTAVVRCCDVTRCEEVQLLANMVIAQYGVPELVFNNVGVTVGKPVLDYTKEDWRWVFEANLFAAWDTARVFAREAIAAARACRIVFTASEHGLGYPHPGMAAYTASKHALLGLAEGFRAELAGRVDVSVFCPGLVQSRLWEAERHRPGYTAEPNPLGQMIMAKGRDPLEIGRMAVDGVERGDFIIVSHPDSRRYAVHRWNEIDTAFRVLDNNYPDTPECDVGSIIAELSAKSGA